MNWSGRIGLVSLLNCLFITTTSQASIINQEYIQNYITFDAPYETSHGANEDYLGTGMLYYSIVYMNKCKTCVCIGSGGGFVPRIMRQAQRDLNLNGSITYLVDADTGVYGRPMWMSEDSFFRTYFNDIQLCCELSHDFAKRNKKKLVIDYLHIDADHSEKGCLQDFLDYLPLMAPGGIITLHDTGALEGPAKVVKRIQKMGYPLIDLKHLGAGVAIVHIPKKKK